MRHALLPGALGALLMTGCASYTDETSDEPRALSNQRPPALLILPFAPLGVDETRYGWIGLGLHEYLVAQVSQAKTVPVIAPTSQPAVAAPLDMQRAMEAAHQVHADLVLFGSYQVAGTDVSFAGQLLDASSGRSLGGISASGSVQQVVALEDKLAGQLKELLAQAGPVTLSSAPGAIGYGSGYAAAPREYTETYGYTTYYEPYPCYWAWCPPFFGAAFFDFDFDHHHHHDFDRSGRVLFRDRDDGRNVFVDGHGNHFERRGNEFVPIHTPAAGLGHGGSPVMAGIGIGRDGAHIADMPSYATGHATSGSGGHATSGGGGHGANGSGGIGHGR